MISRAAAAQVASRYAGGVGRIVHVELGYFTDDGYIGVGPNGKLSTDPKHRIIVDRLIWLFSYPDAPSLSQGPGPQRHAVAVPPSGPHRTPLFVPVDATTGHVLIVWQANSEERAPEAPPD